MQDSQQQDAEEFFCLYLGALDQELLALSTGGHRPATATSEVEEHEVIHSGQIDVGKRGFTVGHLFHLSELSYALLTDA